MKLRSTEAKEERRSRVFSVFFGSTAACNMVHVVNATKVIRKDKNDAMNLKKEG